MSFKRHVALFASAMIVVSALVVPISAQDNTGNGLQISPTRTGPLEVSPGEVKNFSVTIKNVTQAPVIAKVTLNDFESDGTTGQPRIIVDSTEPLPTSLGNFLQGLRDVELDPGESEQLDLIVDVPGDAAPGAYYGAIRFTATSGGADEETDRQVTLTASVATLVLVEVSGNITEQIQVRKVQALRNDKPGSFFLSPPDQLAVEVKNNGNSFSQPFGRVTISKGSKEVYAYELNANDPRGSILPSSVRIFKDKIENVNSIGRYSANISVSHGNGGQIITQKINFWYIPAWFIAVVVALVAAVAILGYLFYRKKYGKRRVKQPRKK